MTRTRFAPSPTGQLHIGGLRTALFAYIWAKKNHGQFLVRIEDTDKTREVEWARDALLDTLELFGIHPDESIRSGGEFGPYIQSERLSIYHEYVGKLVSKGDAYYCFTTEEELEAHKKKAEEAGIMIPFRSPYRDITLDEAKAKMAAGEKYVIRMKIPKGEIITFHDGLKGKISVPSADIDDQILLKTDGFPTYHLAMAVDDHLMKITHVFRWDEWLPSTPKHVLLYRMFGWEAPEFYHLSVILWSDRKKLSKRNGDTHVSQFLEKGYLKEALLNYIALIGWNSKTTQEIFSLEELIQAFSLDGLQIANGIFDPEKLKWMNSKYIAAMPVEELFKTLSEYLKIYNADFYENTFIAHDEYYNQAVIREVQKRCETLADFPELSECFYHEPEVDTALLLSEKMHVTDFIQVKEALEFGLMTISDLHEQFRQNAQVSSEVDDYESHTPLRETLKNLMLPKIAEMGKKNGQILWPLRVALTGKEFSPGAFEMIEILGLDKAQNRIQRVLEKITEKV